MQCRDFREVADSYLGDELLIETNHDVIRHLEGCADCRRELAARREMRARLRAAFANATTLQSRDEFTTRLRTQLRAATSSEAKTSSAFARRGAWLALATCLIIAAAFGLRAIQQRLREQNSSAQLANINRPRTNQNNSDTATPSTDVTQSVKVVMAELAESAAGDHRDCAINHRLAEAPVDLEEAGRKYDRAYIDLKNVVMSRLGDLPDQVEFVVAHACVFEGRRYGHVILKHRGRLVSVLVTELDRPATKSKQSPSNINQVIACSQTGDYQVSCFETARHAVFVVSDLSEAQNLAVARALAPSVYGHIERAESAA